MRRLLTLLLTVLLAMTVCTINVTAEDNSETLTLDVTYVVENTLPEILGAKDKTIFVGEKFDALKGVSATDAEDGDLQVGVTGEVNANKAGKYEITYSTSDNDGGAVSKTVTITVIEKLIDSKDTVIETDTKVESGSPVSSVSTEMKSDVILETVVREDDNKTSNLTADQKQAIKDGADVKLELTVAKTDDSAKEDSKTIEEAVKNKNSGTAIGALLDINLLCTVTKNDRPLGTSKITVTSEPVTITVTVPDALINTDSTVTRNYDVARLHDGKVDLLDAKYDSANKKLIFSTDKFSTYAIVYTDTKVEQTPVYIPNKKKPVVNTSGSLINGTQLELDANGEGSKELNLVDSSCNGLRVKFENLILTRENGTETLNLSAILKDMELTENADYLITEDNSYTILIGLENGTEKIRPGKYSGNVSILINETTGTETDPYHISSISDWVHFAAKDSDYHVDRYYVVDCDLDFSETSDVVCLPYFYGKIDFQNHELKGFTSTNIGNCAAVFEEVGPKTVIKNVSFTTMNYMVEESQMEALRLAYMLPYYQTGVDLLFENVSVYGDVTLANNNSGLILNWAVGTKGSISFKNCKNYANIINSGYTAPFMGLNYGWGYVNDVIYFENCENYGTIISTNNETSMLISNPTKHSGDQMTLNVSNCKNYGKLLAGAGKKANLALNVGSSGEAFYSEEEIKAFETEGKIVNTGEGVCTNVSSTELSVTSENTFDFATAINNLEGADYYVLSFQFQGTGGNANGGVTAYDYKFENTEELLSESIYAYEWKNAVVRGTVLIPEDDITEYTMGDNKYYTAEIEGETVYVYNQPGCWMGNHKPVVNLVAYDSNGTILLVGYYRYQ